MIKKTVTKVKENNEHDARKNLMEELFNDFHRSRRQVYGINFVRGIFFGVGSVIGGTIVVALVLWLLSLLVDLPGGIGDFVQFVVDIVQNRN
ncbi:hypothetical protein H7200_01850 [Candidatus Saccharibacteria bacterium]|nr:hypothetical protein [Candidatus Saccharibacteria bacterium]